MSPPPDWRWWRAAWRRVRSLWARPVQLQLQPYPRPLSALIGEALRVSCSGCEAVRHWEPHGLRWGYCTTEYHPGPCNLEGGRWRHCPPPR